MTDNNFESRETAPSRPLVILDLDAKLASAQRDAESIFELLPGPDLDEGEMVEKLLRVNREISERMNFFSLIEFCNLLNTNRLTVLGLKKHLPTYAAKDFVVDEWARYRDEYKNNKSEFSRIYVRRVFNEFNVTVSEKQMKEVWLVDNPPAGKPAGLQASGE